METFDDINSDNFINPHAEKFFKSIGDEQSKRISNLLKKRRQVNDKAIEIVNEKGFDLCSSLLGVYAERNSDIAVIIDMGWAVDSFVGVSSFFDRLAIQAVEKNLIEKAVLYRVFSIAVSKVGIGSIEDPTLDEMLGRLYNLEVDAPEEEDWDVAHARLVLDEAEGEIFWEKAQEGLTKEINDELGS
jgi:hypothetical protein